MEMTLLERHQQLGAQFVERDGFTLPRSYGDFRAEYESMYFGSGVIDLAHFTVLRVQGADRADWLHKLVTVNVLALPQQEKAYGLLLNAKGHVVADFNLLRLPEMFLLYSSAAAKSRLSTQLRRAIFREKVTLDDNVDLALLSLQGALAEEMLTQTLGINTAPPASGFSTSKFFDGDLLIVSNPRVQAGGIDLLVERKHLEILWDMLVAKGAKPIGIDALNAARIEAGIAWYGDDFDETILAPEARLDEFIAENKGCYTGQEVIARIKNRGHVNRWLTQFRVQGAVVPQRGDIIFVDGNEVGWITSAAWSFENDAPCALGYLRREQVQEAVAVQIAHGETRLDAVVKT
jgi:folate-binding protein YgfZ